MARGREDEEPKRPLRPATTPDAREDQLISLAVDLAEEQLRAGTASAQVVTHLLKLGSSRERLEQQRIAHENELLKIKAENLASATRMEELYGRAIKAMSTYSGNTPPQEEPDDY